MSDDLYDSLIGEDGAEDDAEDGGYADWLATGDG